MVIGPEFEMTDLPSDLPTRPRIREVVDSSVDSDPSWSHDESQKKRLPSKVATVVSNETNQISQGRRSEVKELNCERFTLVLFAFEYAFV